MTPPPPFHPSVLRGDDLYEVTLRPRTFDQFVGQKRVVENLRLALDAATARGDTLDHLLLSGLPGLGKTTLAGIVARRLGTNLHETSGPSLLRPADLVGILSNLEEGDFLFVDEVHRLPRPVEEKLYSAMEDYQVDIVLETGHAARSLRMTIKPFTLIGATTREGLLTAPFRARFGLQEKLDNYTPDELTEVVERSAKALNVSVTHEAACFIGARSRGTPRVANRYLRRVRDLAQEKYGNAIDLEVAQAGLQRLGIDEHGMSAVDRKILHTLHRHGGGPVGVKTIAVAVGEEERTVEEVYEPYLIRSGFLQRTPQGRCLSTQSRELLGEPQPGLLF